MEMEGVSAYAKLVRTFSTLLYKVCMSQKEDPSGISLRQPSIIFFSSFIINFLFGLLKCISIL